MPVVVDPDPLVVESLLASMPAGSHGVESVDRLNAWLTSHGDEYVVVLGPTLTDEESVTTCEALRTAAPTISTILVRESMDTDLLTFAMKAGARDVIHQTDTAALTEAIARAYHLFVALRGPAGAMHVSKVISVFSPKGGVGKTTLSVNLALALTAKGARRVCLVDLDLAFGDVAITMQLFPTHSIEQAIGSEDSMDVEMLDSLLTRHQDSLMVLAAPPHPDTRERVSPRLVSRIIRTLRETFDYVVIDMAPSFDEQVLTALDETDEVVLVATLDVPTLKNVKVAVETFDALHIAKDNRHLVLNRADDEVGINADKVEGILGMSVATQLLSSVDIAAATNAGSPIVVSDPEHQLSIAIRELATRLAGHIVAPPGVDPATATSAPQAKADAEARGRLRRRSKS
jgi:pilus assembly protein CpaE